MSTMNEPLACLPQIGQVQWIGIRPARREPVISVESVEAVRDKGLTGDRYKGTGGKRQVTLIQYEHLDVMASLLNRTELNQTGPDMKLDPALLRRNIAVSGINLLALKGKQFRIGTAVFEYTGLCHPCSRMEELFGPGGYNAVRGHGGINVRVLESGVIRLNDSVQVFEAE